MRKTSLEVLAVIAFAAVMATSTWAAVSSDLTLSTPSTATSPIVAGSNIVYTFNAINNTTSSPGNSGPANTITVTVSMPTTSSGTTAGYVSLNVPAGWTFSTPSQGSTANIVVTNTSSALINGSPAAFTLTAKIASNGTGTVSQTNTIAYTAASGNTDTNGTNNTIASTASTVNVAAAPTVTATTTNILAQSATTVLINGTGFSTTLANNSVSFSTLSAVGNVTAVNGAGTQLTVTFTTKPTSTGSLTAIVTSNGGTSGTAAQVATVVASPVATATTTNVVARNAPTVLINGTGFSTTLANNSVSFSTLGAAGNVTAVNGTGTQLTVTFTTQPTATGSLTAIVTSNGGTSGTAVQVATVVLSPVVMSNATPLAQNATTLIIAGANFSAINANNIVTLSSGTATITVATTTQLTCTLGGNVAAGNLTAVVSLFGGSSGAAVQVATIVPAPSVTLNAANLAINASTLLITGANFSVIPSDNAVTLSSGTATVTAATSTQLTISLSGTIALGNMTASIALFGGNSGAAVQVATVVSTATVAMNTANLAQNAPVLVIGGTGFSANPSDNVVTFSSGVGVVTASSSTQLTVALNGAISLGNLMASVTVFGGGSGASVQVATIVPAPIVTSASTNMLQTDPTVTINGSNFSTTPASNTVVFSSGTGTVTAATATQLTVTFATQPNTGPLSAVVTSNLGSSGLTMQVATVGIAPIITSANATSFTATVAGTFAVTGKGTPLPSLSIAPALPSGVSLFDNQNGTATLTGTPMTFGIFQYTITAQNGFGVNAQQSFTLTIGATLALATPPFLQAGKTFNQALAITGGTAAYSFTLKSGKLPTGITLTSAGLLSGTPTVSGKFPISLIVKDSSLPASAGPYTQVLNTTLIVSPAYILISPYTLLNAQANIAYSQSLSAYGGTAPYTFAINDGALPPGIVMSSNGVFTGTPTTAGNYTFTISIADSTGGTGPSTQLMPSSILVNQGPVIASGLIAVPNPASTGVPVQFSATVTDTTNDQLTYRWDFSDGTISSLPNPSHVFTVPGVRSVNLQVSDQHGGLALNSIRLVVQDHTAASLDTDGDGYPDAIEIALGSDPNDPNSTPFGLPPVTNTDVITSVKMSTSLSFVTIFNDSITLSGVLPLPTSFSPAGQIAIVDVGGVINAFKFDANGKLMAGAAKTTSSFSIAMTSKKVGRAFKLSLKKGNFSAALANVGLVDAPAKNKPVVVPITIIVGNTLFSVNAQQSFSTKDSQTGTSTSP